MSKERISFKDIDAVMKPAGFTRTLGSTKTELHGGYELRRGNGAIELQRCRGIGNEILLYAQVLEAHFKITVNEGSITIHGVKPKIRRYEVWLNLPVVGHDGYHEVVEVEEGDDPDVVCKEVLNGLIANHLDTGWNPLDD